MSNVDTITSIVDKAMDFVKDNPQVLALAGGLFERFMKPKTPEKPKDEPVTPVKPKTVIMSNSVRHFLLYGLSEEDKKIANYVIDENEANGVNEYNIRLSNRIFHIKNGQIAGSAVF